MKKAPEAIDRSTSTIVWIPTLCTLRNPAHWNLLVCVSHPIDQLVTSGASSIPVVMKCRMFSAKLISSHIFFFFIILYLYKKNYLRESG